MTLAERLEQIKAQALKDKEARELALLDTDEGVSSALKAEDMKVLKEIKDRVASAYDFKGEFPIGFTFNETIETLVAITNRLQYAKATVRALLQPGTGEVNLYELFNSDLRRELLEAYGSMPYNRNPQVIVDEQGVSHILDKEICDRAREGVKPDIEKLNTLISMISLRIGLLGEYKATQEQADIAWNTAKNKINVADTLKKLQEELEK